MPSGPSAPAAERLVRRTSRSLAAITLVLIAALLAAVGVVAAAVTLRATDEGIDRTLRAAADARVAILQAQANALEDRGGDGDNSGPGSDNSGSGSDNSGSGSDNSGSGSDNSGSGSDNSGSGSDNSGSGSDNSGSGSSGNDKQPRRTDIPRPTPTPTNAPTPSPTASPAFGLPSGDQTPQSADTFFLLLDRSGTVISNPQDVMLSGLPDPTAVAVASGGIDDWRTVDVNGVRVRLLTRPIVESDGDLAGILQSGFVLTLRDQQSSQLILAIALACLGGLAGAGLVTLAVTRRAMKPIRSAFDAERRFVASASHELRTPVAVVRASAEILQREDLVKPDGAKLVDDIIGETDRLARLVSDMLALASAEAGAITVDPREIEMRTFVAELGRRAESIATERGVKIEVVQDGAGRAADRELVVSADPDRMTQLLLIFIDNAIDHSPPGGTVRLFVRAVDEGARQQVAVGVADEGPGVPVEARTRIFEPFARLTGRRRETGNTGLGLAIARILAARQDASLHVDDAVGGGAVFSVLLPRLLPR